jgi:hypothetical protein
VGCQLLYALELILHVIAYRKSVVDNGILMKVNGASFPPHVSKEKTISFFSFETGTNCIEHVFPD